MKERPILFSAPMVRAILSGKKTQTRRVVKIPEIVRGEDSGETCIEWVEDHEAGPGFAAYMTEYPEEGSILIRCPYGAPGDRLWVRETFTLQEQVDGDAPPFDDGRPIQRDDDGHWVQPHYFATDTPPDLACEDDRCRTCERDLFGPHWKPSIHMPRWASRITLEITGVRVERLNEIGDADCFAEGIGPLVEAGALGYAQPRGVFRELWESINGDGSWNANPWIWVVEFRRLTP